ncbi:hypothetical protein QAD02_014631 [Eretmocerus hayati]|uniref:Uncharacterized protein n=1 Tax=Eretmocerus hayati TaxID=131215 RepID=A0ACC2P8B8_9HYME|nr:hypothetical protein QAD02_014631 [Eretmocerus hayati]
MCNQTRYPHSIERPCHYFVSGLALLLAIVVGNVHAATDNSSLVETEASEEASSSGPSKRSPLAATAIYGAGPANQAHHGPPAHYVLRPSDEAQEVILKFYFARYSATPPVP